MRQSSDRWIKRIEMTSGASLPPGIDVSGIRIAPIESLGLVLNFYINYPRKNFPFTWIGDFQTTRVFFFDRLYLNLIRSCTSILEMKIEYHFIFKRKKERKKLPLLSLASRNWEEEGESIANRLNWCSNIRIIICSWTQRAIPISSVRKYESCSRGNSFHWENEIRSLFESGNSVATGGR